MPKRNAEYMERKRNEILDAAMDCLSRRGMSGFSTTQICEEAGISMGALYTHFKSKNAIILALVERGTEDRTALLAITTYDELHKIIIGLVKSLNTLQNIQKIRSDLELLTASNTDPQLAAAMASVFESKDMENVLKNLQLDGEISSSVDVKGSAAAISAQLIGFSVYAATGDYYVKARVEAMEILMRTLRD